ncbi:Maf family protein [Gracilibacillus massiliensis]|uniref:Maf family protein n=1 Tax=Gracilibacillus massiliensis TaxID=1564956 RepID=UPI00071DBD0F|nr:Maf family protein [Gracilibacillus massiliensis]
MLQKLILASSSPRRQELLQQMRIPFQIRKPNLDESQIKDTDPVTKVKQLAILKGKNVPIQTETEVILAADTVVSFQQNIFEKPKSKQEAYKMIKGLSGKKHHVYTGVMIRCQEKEMTFVESTTVSFWPLTEKEILSYIETEEPYDKAGGYGIQSVGAMFVKRIEGDYYNVVGLPISRVVRELKTFGIHPQ